MLFSKGFERLLAVFEQRLDKIEQNNARTSEALLENTKTLLGALLEAQDKILALSGDAILKLKTPEIAKAQANSNEYDGPMGEILKIPAMTEEDRMQKNAAVNELNAIIAGAKVGYD